MSNIPRIRGNIPVPGVRKVPIGMLKERRVVTAPNRKITTPPIISSLFNRFTPSNFPSPSPLPGGERDGVRG
jgi:hypothetical protein